MPWCQSGRNNGNGSSLISSLPLPAHHLTSDAMGLKKKHKKSWQAEMNGRLFGWHGHYFTWSLCLNQPIASHPWMVHGWHNLNSNMSNSAMLVSKFLAVHHSRPPTRHIILIQASQTPNPSQAGSLSASPFQSSPGSDRVLHPTILPCCDSKV